MRAALRPRKLLLLAGALGALAGACSGAATANPNSFFTLDNGLKVVLYEKHGIPLLNLTLAVNFGSKDESEGNFGWAHLLEHCLLFQGGVAPGDDEAIGVFRRNGAFFNGTTTQDLTFYEMSLPIERADFALTTMKGLFSEPAFGAGDIDREKDIIMEEVGALRDDPRRWAAVLIYENLFAGHPYCNPLFGDQGSVMKAGPEELRVLHGKYYVPSNCSLAIVGDFTFAEMEPRVRAMFENLRGPAAPRTVVPKANPLKKTVDVRKEMDIEEAYLAIGFVGPDSENPDQYPAELLTEILGRGFNPMLNTALRSRRDLIKSISMSYASLKWGGVFIVLYALDPKDVSQARNETLSFLRKVRGLNFAKEDYYGDEQFAALDYLRGAKNQIRFGAQKGWESGLHLATAFARYVLLSEHLNEPKGFMDRINRVQSSDIRKVAARYLSEGDYVVVAIVPERKLETALKLVFITLAALLVSAAQGAVSDGDGPVKRSLKNGLTWIYQHEGSSGTTSAFFVVGGGQSAEPSGRAGLAYVAARLAVEASDPDKVREFMVKSTRVSVLGQEDCVLIGIQCLSENLEDALRTVGGIMIDPLFSGFRIDAIKENMRYQQKSALDDDVSAGHAEAMRAFFGPDGCGAPAWGTKESLDGIRKKDITEFYSARITGANIIASFATDLDEPTVAGWLGKYFSALKTGDPVKTPPPEAHAVETAAIEVDKESPETYLALACPLPALTARTYALAYLVDDVLSGGIGSRLWQLRFQDRLAYSFNANVTQTSGRGLLEVYLKTSSGHLAAAKAALRRVLAGLAEGGLTPRDLETAVTDSESTFLRMHETKDFLARDAALFEFRGLGCGFLRTFPAELRAVTLDEINGYLKAVLAPGEMVEVVIGPLAR